MTQEVKPSQVAQLQMENEKLKEERDFYIQRLKDVSSENTCPIIKELKEENEKLKEENEKLKDDLINAPTYKMYEGWMEGEILKLNEENDKLKAEIKQKDILEAEMTSISKTLAEMGCKQNPDTPEHKHLPTIAEAVKIILKDFKDQLEDFTDIAKMYDGEEACDLNDYIGKLVGENVELENKVIELENESQKLKAEIEFLNLHQKGD